MSGTETCIGVMLRSKFALDGHAGERAKGFWCPSIRWG